MNVPSDLAARERREHTEGLSPLRSLRSFVAIVFLAVFSSVALADDVITNVMSPVVSYQYPDDFSSQALTNGGISSPIVSYQYFEWPGDDVLELLSSPRVSYFYQIGSEPLPLVLHGRVTDTLGVGISSAAISATVGLTPAAQTTTDASGNYALPALGAGVYALAASASGHARSARAVTLSAATATQNFQLTALPTAPILTQTDRQPPTVFTQPPVGPMGSTLKVFDGAQFVAITAGNTPPSDRMTIVMTHGWNSNPDVWATNMVAQLRAKGVNANMANIVAWDWRTAAGAAIPEERTPSQGVALGQALQSEAALGAGYSQKIHFIGHSLGTLVNAAAANFLHGDRTAQQAVSATPWSPTRTHLTLLDAAELAAGLEVLPIGSLFALFNGISVSVGGSTDLIGGYDNVLLGWKPALPVRRKWADNYVSLVGLYQPDAVNVYLDKAKLIFDLNPIETLIKRHAYSFQWYGLTVASPSGCTLGFQRSHEARQAGLSAFDFPPSSSDFPPGVAYLQPLLATDPLTLTLAPPFTRAFGIGQRWVVRGAAGVVEVAGDVTAQVMDGAQAAGQWISSGFDYVGDVAAQSGQAVVNLYNSPVLRLLLRTQGILLPSPMALRDGTFTLSAAGAGDSPSPPMAWLPIQFPANATAMAFDFMVEGNPMDDVMVCGIGTNNLFSLEAKYIPTNTISASRLIDVSAWAGRTNELFFGFMGGTSSNATLVIENIRFYSLAEPRLEIFVSGSTSLLSWSLTAGGYVVETTPRLDLPAWEALTNAPAISADRYVLTNSWSDQTRFFRLRAR